MSDFNDTRYYNKSDEIKNHLSKVNSLNFSMLNLNIRSISKNFDNFMSLLDNLNFNFKIICLSETWLHSDNAVNSNLEIPGYTGIHQVRKNGNGGGLAIFIHNSYCA